MPNFKELNTHNDCRSHVCLFCFNKSSFNLLDYPEYIEIVKSEIIEDFDPDSVFYPTGLCENHKRRLNDLKQKLSGVSVSRNISFNIELLGEFLRETKKVNRDADSCQVNCLICKVAKAKGNMVKKILSEVPANKRGPSDTSKPLALCGKCLHPKRKGLRGHICNQTNLLQNIENFIPSQVQEKIESKIIKSKMKENISKDDQVSLATGAKPLKLNFMKK